MENSTYLYWVFDRILREHCMNGITLFMECQNLENDIDTKNKLVEIFKD